MEGQSSSTIKLNIDEMACSIRSQINHHNSLYHKQRHGRKLPLIYRVPKQIRQVDPVSYEPMLVSIGPYHYFAPNVIAMEREKWKCLKFILKLNHRKELQDYLLAIMEVQEQVRICYQDDINTDSNNFIQMLLLDSCFLLHSVYATNEVVEPPPEVYERRNSGKVMQFHERVGTSEIQNEELSQKYGHSDVVADQAKQGEVDADQFHITQTDTRDDLFHGQAQSYLDEIGMWYTSYVNRDILLLENQIPFFILKVVYEILAYKKAINTPLTETLSKYIEGTVKSYPKAIKESDRPKDFQHLLHLCHTYFKPSQIVVQDHKYQIQPHYLRRLVHKCVRYFIPSNQCEDVSSLLHFQRVHFQNGSHMKCWRRALQYHEAGVQFRKREQSMHAPHSLLDIAFEGGVLEIPRLIIDDKTCTLLRNFIAFEQACPQFGNDLTAYVAFMSQLISTTDDVTLLSCRGIVVHHMRSDGDVSFIFGKLGKNVDFDMSGSHYLKPLCQQLEEHYQNRINRWMAWLWQNHFSNPWLSLAVVAAAVVLICTILQTLISFLAYAKPAM